MNILLYETSAEVAPPETATVRAKRIIPELDGVRAIACLLVIWLHINLITSDMHIWTSGATPPLIHALLVSGSIGVTLFFVLSGFLLFLPYVQALLGTQPWPSARQFYLRRAWRILPGYYASLFLLVLLQQPQYLSPSHWRDLALFLVVFMDSIPATFQHLNGPFWTLAIEWQFYLLLPVLALGVRALVGRLPLNGRGGRGWRTAGCLVLLLGWGVFSRYVGAWLVAHPTAAPPLLPRRALDVLVFFLYGVRGKYLEDFACGMLASLCYTVLRDPTHSQALRRLQRISPWVGGGVAGMALAGMALATHGALFAPSGGSKISGLSGLAAALVWSGELSLSLGFASGILAILFGGSRARLVFAWMPLRWIGLISYSLYIWHLPLLVVFMHQIGPRLSGLPTVLAYALYWAWVGIVVIPFATGVYWLVERPAIRMGERMLRALCAGRSPASAPARQPTSGAAILARQSVEVPERDVPHDQVASGIYSPYSKGDVSRYRYPSCLSSHVSFAHMFSLKHNTSEHGSNEVKRVKVDGTTYRRLGRE
jgi:peptidoglycan/LPS O-acetylase OafA/YrhL